MAYKGTLKSINQKNAIYRKFIGTKNPHCKEIYHTRHTRINKSKYYKTFFSEQKTNSKQTWEAVRSLINVTIESNKQITSLNKNNQIETNSKTISEAFNKFFPQLPKILITKLFLLAKQNH